MHNYIIGFRQKGNRRGDIIALTGVMTPTWHDALMQAHDLSRTWHTIWKNGRLIGTLEEMRGLENAQNVFDQRDAAI